MPNPAIGYVTSGDRNDFYGSFRTGLEASGIWVTTGAGKNVEIYYGEAKGEYDTKGAKRALDKHMRVLSSKSDVRLIVAVGGLVTAFAAARSCQKPFLVIIGQVPAVDDFELDPDTVPLYCGGVDLATTAANTVRNDRSVARVGGGCKPEEVCLVFNENARMSRSERREWVAHGWQALAGGVDAQGDNDEDEFERVFRKARKRGYKAVVISSDPFFAHKRNALVTAANTIGGPGPNFALRFCYPAQYFAVGAPVPTPGRDLWYGPDLSSAYDKLGRKAGELLTKINASGPEFMGLEPLPSTGANI